MSQFWEHLENPSKVLPKPKGVRDKIEAENKTLMLLPTFHIPKLKIKYTDCDIKTFSALIMCGSRNSILPRDSALQSVEFFSVVSM